ncbi:Vesicle transport protein SFT2B [Bienertia sinuspersici]
MFLLCGSTAFLIGPAEQVRKMFDPVRVYATAVYLGCAVLALICAILVVLHYINFGHIHSKILTMLSMICEICALIW